MGSLDQAVKNREEIGEIKRKLVTGEISYQQAKALAQPVLDRINEQTVRKTKELNKKYGLNRKPALLDFVQAMRNTYN